MQTIPVEIDDEVNFHALLVVGGAFDFLRDEPELYSDADIRPGRANPAFGKRGSMIPATPVPGEFVTTHATSNTAAAR